jgi:hypothetical protein
MARTANADQGVFSGACGQLGVRCGLLLGKTGRHAKQADTDGANQCVSIQFQGPNPHPLV